MRKFLTISMILILLGSAGTGGYYFYHKHKVRNETKQQLADVQNKIDQLPDLEKDIFSKCMEGKSGKATEIKFCEENTQKEMFTLSQDLTNLKNNLETKLR